MKKWLCATFYDVEAGNEWGRYDIIEAETKEEAVAKYDEKHESNYFYGSCVGEFDEKTGNLIIPVTHLIPRYGKE